MHRHLIIQIDDVTPGEPTIAALTGSFDSKSVADFELGFKRLLALKQPRIVLDLSEIEYMSSAGVGAVMTLLSAAREHGGEVAFVRPPQQVYALFEMLDLPRVFKLCQNRQEAAAYLSGLSPTER